MKTSGPVANHKLKTLAPYYEEVRDGHKTFELRYNDRDFTTGDLLILQEQDPKTGETTGRNTTKEVTYVLAGPEAELFGLQPGYCILGVEAA